MLEVLEQIRRHPTFQAEMERIARLEEGRRFCCHGLQHSLDVARIGYEIILEQQLPISKQTIYAAALLHDIGKGVQYDEGTPHQLAGLPLAESVLKDCGFPADEIESILEAIRLHRKPAESGNPMVSVLYQADKKSRACYCCQARAECNWPMEKRTAGIEY